MQIRTFRLAPGDTDAHPLSATSILAQYVDIWPDDGSGIVRFGDKDAQYGFAPYGLRPDNNGATCYDLSQVYYKLTSAGDALVVAYAPR